MNVIAIHENISVMMDYFYNFQYKYEKDRYFERKV